MVNDRLDPLPLADLLAAERRAPGIPDVARVRLSRRLADLHRSSFAVPEDASTALRAASARGHSTAMLMAVAGMALVVGVGAGLAANALLGQAPAVATQLEATPHLGPSPVTEPVLAPTLPPSPTAAAAPPALVPTPIATTPPRTAPGKKRSAAPETQAAAAPGASTALPLRTPPAPANDEPPPTAVDEPASSAVPWAVLALNLSESPTPHLSKSPASGNREHLYLDLAHDAVRSDDATTAIALVKAHKKKFPTSHNSEKRDLLWIQALVIDRKYDFARNRIEKFQRRYPRSRHLRALRNQLSRFPLDRPPIPRAVRAVRP